MWTAAIEVAAQARSTYRRAKHYRAVARKTKGVAGDVVHAPEETADWVTGETKRTPGWVKVVVVILILVYPPWLLAHEASNLRVLPGVPFGPSWGDLLGVTVPGVDEAEVWEGLRPGEAMPAGWTPSMGQVAEHAKADVCGDDPAAVPAGWPKLPWQDEEPDEGPWLTETFKALGAVMAREMFDPDNLIAYGAWWKDVTSVAVGAAADAFLDADTPSPQVAEYEAAHAAKVEALVPDCGCGTSASGGSGADLARAAASAAGFTGRDLEIAVAVAGAESSYNPQAANPTSNARGMWQIMTTAHPEKLAGRDVMDPYDNAEAAYEVWREAGGWSPWAVYNSGAYQEFMGSTAEPCEEESGGTFVVGATDLQGRYENGRIPSAALCSLRTASGHIAACDAARAFDAMSAAYKDRFGSYISVTDAYRTYESQVRVRAAKPHLAAVPGTSNHGWGRAFDLGGGIQNYGTPQHEWVVANGPTYGFRFPNWARQGGGKEEPWHHEFVGGAPTAMAG